MKSPKLLILGASIVMLCLLLISYNNFFQSDPSDLVSDSTTHSSRDPDRSKNSKKQALKEIANMSLADVLRQLPSDPFTFDDGAMPRNYERALYSRLGEIAGEDAINEIMTRYPGNGRNVSIIGCILEGWAAADSAATAEALTDLLEGGDLNEHDLSNLGAILEWKGDPVCKIMNHGPFGGGLRDLNIMSHQALSAITINDPDLALSLLSAKIFGESTLYLVSSYTDSLNSNTDWESLSSRLNSALEILPSDENAFDDIKAAVTTSWARHDFDKALDWTRDQTSEQSLNSFKQVFLSIASKLQRVDRTYYRMDLATPPSQVRANSNSIFQWLNKNYDTQTIDDGFLYSYVKQTLVKERHDWHLNNQMKANLINISRNENLRQDMILDIVNIGTKQSKHRSTVHPNNLPSIENLINLFAAVKLSPMTQEFVRNRINAIAAERNSKPE